MHAKMGRPPKSGETRSKSLNLRLTEDELKRIEHCSEKKRMSRTDTLMYGISLIEKEK